MAALVQEAGEDVLRQQADVFGEHSDDVLENEAAGAHAVSDTKDERVKGVGDVLAASRVTWTQLWPRRG